MNAAVVFAVLLTTPADQNEKAPAGLPTQLAPMQVLAGVDKDGTFVVRENVTSYQLAPGGNTYIPAVTLVTWRFKLQDVKVFDTKGQQLSEAEVRRVIRDEVPALTGPRGEKVDPLHLRLIKEGTPILLLPKPPVGVRTPPEPERVRYDAVPATPS
jgi:hypothetical protein